MPYVKAHPFGYQPIKNKQSTNLSRFTHHREPVQRTQTVRMLVPVEEPVRDANGKILYEGRGKKRKPITRIVAYHTQTRVIKHYDQSHRKGRTLAEMVYETFISDKK